MNHRFPSFLMSFVTTVLAFFAVILVPCHAFADTPPADPFPVVRTLADGSQVVAVTANGDMRSLIKRYASLYKSSTGGEELTWQVIEAANKGQIIPVCLKPADGVHYTNTRDRRVWDNCADADKTAVLVPNTQITIPLKHVETYDERMARIEAAIKCQEDATCLQQKLAALGVNTPQGDGHKLEELEEQVKRLSAENSILRNDKTGPEQQADEVPAEAATPLSETEEPLTFGSFFDGLRVAFSSRPLRTTFWFLGFMVGFVSIPYVSYRNGKRRGKREAEKRNTQDGDEIVESLTELPRGEYGTQTQKLQVPRSVQQSAKTAEMRKALAGVSSKDENTALKKRIAELEAENAQLRAQPPPQVVVTNSNVVIQTSAAMPHERETQPDIKKPVTTPALPLAPVFGPPPAPPPTVTRVSYNEAELEALIEKDRVELTNVGSFKPDQMIALGRKIQENEAKLATLRAPVVEPIPPLDVPSPVERISVPDVEHDNTSDRITIPMPRGDKPVAPPSLTQQEREIATLKDRLKASEQDAKDSLDKALLIRTRCDRTERLIQRLLRRREWSRKRFMDIRASYSKLFREHSDLRYSSKRQREELVRRIRVLVVEPLRKARITEAASWEGRDAGMQFRLREAAYDHANEMRRQHDASDKARTLHEATHGLRHSLLEDCIHELADALAETHGEKQRLIAWKAKMVDKIIPRLFAHRSWLRARMGQLASDLEGANALNQSIDEKRSQFATLWPQVQEMFSEVDATASQGEDVTTRRQILDGQLAQAGPLFKELTGVDVFDVMGLVAQHAVGAPPPSDRAFQKSVSIRPKVPIFDPEATYVPNGDDDPSLPARNGHGHTEKVAYKRAAMNPNGSATGIDYANGSNGLPSPNDLANQLLQEGLIRLLEETHFPSMLMVDRQMVDRLKKFFLIQTKWSPNLLMQVPPNVMEALCKDNPQTKSRSLLTAVTLLAKQGVFTPDTLFPTHEHHGLPPLPNGDPSKNGA